MAQPRSSYYTVAGHEMHVTEWGDPASPAVVMWHGLARQGRDFDTIARQLAPLYRIICPDTIGRGLSSWSADPEIDYTIPAYCGHAVELLDRLEIASARWIGSSMGGLIGMGLAGTAATAGRIERLVLNDVGPVLNPAALDRIRTYVGLVPEFPTMSRFEAFLRAAYAPFGALSDDEWRAMAEHSVRRRDNGSFATHYDPAIMRAFAAPTQDHDLWALYDAITCPTLVVRGADSDLLLPETADEMTARGPKAMLATVVGCGHAPMLNTPVQIERIQAFLA